jgi:hypothetical protein
MEFSVCYEFSVNRRIPWDDDRETLRTHIGEVRRGIAEHTSVEDATVQSDLENARLAVEFDVFGSNRQAVENDVRDLLGAAIRDAGAYHQGLFPVNEEMRLRPTLNTWSGLRTPTWRVRRSSIALKRSMGYAVSG